MSKRTSEVAYLLENKIKEWKSESFPKISLRTGYEVILDSLPEFQEKKSEWLDNNCKNFKGVLQFDPVWILRAGSVLRGCAHEVTGSDKWQHNRPPIAPSNDGGLFVRQMKALLDEGTDVKASDIVEIVDRYKSGEWTV